LPAGGFTAHSLRRLDTYVATFHRVYAGSV
jgi:hypothetical protein